MRWVSIAELKARGNPRYLIEQERSHLQACVAQAKLEQEERHHNERLAIERSKMDVAERQAEKAQEVSIERERIAGANAIALATHQFALDHAAKSSALIDEMILSQLRQEEDWSKTVADTMRQVIVAHGNGLIAERLKKLEHQQTIERLTFELNAKTIEMTLTNELQDARVSYDKACEITFRLVERALGLGPVQVDAGQIRDWFEEAMGQNTSYSGF